MTEFRRACPACGEPVDLSTPPAYRVDTWSVIRCGSCATGTTHPVPDADAMLEQYDEDYFLARGIQYSGLQRGHRERADALASITPGPRVLEIGCGEGYLLQALKEVGLEVAGCEPSAWAVDVARSRFGLDVFHGTAAGAPFPPATFDLVLLYHVVEHVEEPLELLRIARRFTRQGGLMVVEVPNLDSAQLRFGAARQRHILHLPYHFTHFTPEGLTRLIARADLRLSTLTIPFGPPLRPLLSVFERLRGRHTAGTAPDLSSQDSEAQNHHSRADDARGESSMRLLRRWKDSVLRLLLRVSSDYKMTAYAFRPETDAPVRPSGPKLSP